MLARPRRLLLIRLGSLGDLILTTPVARAARCAFPEAHVAVVTSHPLAAVYASSPHVDEVFTVDRARLNHNASEITRTVRWMRKGRFDVSVDLQRKAKTALLAWAGGIPRRIGGTWLDTDRVLGLPNEHASAEALHALEPLGVESDDARTEVWVSDEDDAAAGSLLRERGIRPGEGPIVGIFPGAGWRPKAWPVERFQEIARLSRMDAGARVVVVGAAKDRDLVERVEGAAECAPFIDLPLGTLAGVLRRCDCVVASDSGPMHLAVAVGTPTIALFGPTSAARFGPGYEPHVVLAEATWASVEATWCAVQTALARGK